MFAYKWKNSEGEIIKETIDAIGADEIDNLSEGFYTVEVSGLTNECLNTYTKEFLIAEPVAGSMESELSINNCNDGANGSISLNFIGSDEIYNVVLKNAEGIVLDNYSNINTSLLINNLENANYLIEAENGCETIFSTIALMDVNAAEAKFEILNNTAIAEESIDLNNTSINATNFVWNMGDGNFYSNTNPAHSYSFPGSYIISLTASNQNCETTIEKPIEIVPSSVGINEYNKNADAFVFINNQNIAVSFNKSFASEVRITDLTGKITYSQKIGAEKNKTVNINTSNFAKGVYVVQVYNNQQSILANKLFID
jgi:PKD repeat protein